MPNPRTSQTQPTKPVVLTHCPVWTYTGIGPSALWYIFTDFSISLSESLAAFSSHILAEVLFFAHQTLSGTRRAYSPSYPDHASFYIRDEVTLSVCSPLQRVSVVHGLHSWLRGSMGPLVSIRHASKARAHDLRTLPWRQDGRLLACGCGTESTRASFPGN
ncbi:hypothetical protein FA95DRAFT_1093489 [Auriscalpium vulgare]|uniref:Uncharacterized protein n=1 Tax=Auriscalpium vulgare TaxID=40419 RepID=A0ACB8R5J1_9AGAM|nr:hypothetical protein FA95DRAFT_1093489 [Auriscalpium vulgare]